MELHDQVKELEVLVDVNKRDNVGVLNISKDIHLHGDNS